MSTLKKTLVGSAGIVVLALVVALIGAGQAAAQAGPPGGPPIPNPLNVLVRNTASQAVPVVLQSPGNASGSVTVANPATNPVQVRDVDNPAGHPFQKQLCVPLATGCVGAINFSVPSGQRLVIEFVSAECTVFDGSDLIISLVTVVGGASAQHAVHLAEATRTSGLAAANFDVNMTTRIYADPGTTVRMQTGTGGPNPPFCPFLTISGYLVSV